MDSTQPKLRFYLFVALFILFCGACFFFIRLDRAAASPSSLSGLAALREMSAQSVPLERALSNGRPTLIEFYADWCTSCQALAPTISQFHEQYGSQVNFVMLNVDQPQWQQQLQQYQVRGVPQFFFIRSDRTVIKTLVGAVPQPILSSWFEKLLHPIS